MANAEEIRQKRAELKRAYGAAYARLSEILLREDPIGINFEENTDEYEPEVGTILPRLGDARSVDDVRTIVHEEFVEWFDAATSGPLEKYEVVAQRVWEEIVPLLRTR
jgi:hypothetical protein